MKIRLSGDTVIYNHHPLKITLLHQQFLIQRLFLSPIAQLNLITTLSFPEKWVSIFILSLKLPCWTIHLQKKGGTKRGRKKIQIYSSEAELFDQVMKNHESISHVHNKNPVTLNRAHILQKTWWQVSHYTPSVYKACTNRARCSWM